jgi:hypothetical protein
MILHTDAIILLPSRSLVLLMHDQIRLYHRHWIVPRRQRSANLKEQYILPCRTSTPTSLLRHLLYNLFYTVKDELQQSIV